MTLLTCSTPGCNRTARHWVRCSVARPQRRMAVCHRCYIKPKGTVTVLIPVPVLPSGSPGENVSCYANCQ